MSSDASEWKQNTIQNKKQASKSQVHAPDKSLAQTRYRD